MITLLTQSMQTSNMPAKAKFFLLQNEAEAYIQFWISKNSKWTDDCEINASTAISRRPNSSASAQ